MKLQERVPVWWLGGISLFYFVCAGLRAAYRPFWYDELVTWHLARLPSVAALWQAIVDGVDQEMPLIHLSVRASHALFGYGGLATRLPMLIGFWIMSICIYRFLSRRVPGHYALLGMVFPMLTYAWPYAFEARAYGIALGAAGIALVSWQSAAEGRGRPWSLAGITLGLTVILSVQSTLGVVAIPFALGEAVRTFSKRRLDWPVWLSFVAACPVAILYPFVRSTVKQFKFPGLQPSVSGYAAFFDSALQTAIFPLLLALLAGCYFGRKEKREETGQLLPRHEAALLVGFLLTPLPYFILGRFSNQFVFFPRYGIMTIIGLACGFAVLACRAAGANRRIASAMLAALMIYLVVARGKEALALAQDPTNTWREDWPVLQQALAKGLPVVVQSTLTFLEGDHYLPENLASHLYWVASDPQFAPHYPWQQFANHFTKADGRDFPLRARVVTWEELSARTQPFYLYTDAQSQWWYEVLPRDGWRLNVASISGGYILYYVDHPPWTEAR